MPMKELRDLEGFVLPMIDHPSFRQLSFDPAKPAGPVRNDRGDGSVNLGIVGLLMFGGYAEANDTDLERLLDDASIFNLREWLPLYHHISRGTVPPDDRPDERGRLVNEYRSNREIYERLGFPPPAIG